MKKIILLILASLTFLAAQDAKIKFAGSGANDGVVFKNSLDSTLVDIGEHQGYSVRWRDPASV